MVLSNEHLNISVNTTSTEVVPSDLTTNAELLCHIRCDTSNTVSPRKCRAWSHFAVVHRHE